MQECMHISIYVCWCAACMCVRLANDFINVNTETKYLICFEEISTFYRQATCRFLLRLQILPRQLPHSFASYVAAALAVNSVSVTTPAKNIMYHLWNLG